jgi:hypothetical protein
MMIRKAAKNSQCRSKPSTNTWKSVAYTSDVSREMLRSAAEDVCRNRDTPT